MKNIHILISPMIFIILPMFFLGTGSAFATPEVEVVYKEARNKKDLQKGKKDKDLFSTDYFYDPVDKTDPFAPFIIKRRMDLSQIEKQTVSDQLLKMLALLEDLKKPRTELQKIGLSELVLTSIIKIEDNIMAMVRGPKGIGYILKKGTYIGKNGGVVDRIESEEKKTDLGKQFIRTVVIKEPYLDNKGNLKYKSIEMKMPSSSFD